MTDQLTQLLLAMIDAKQDAHKCHRLICQAEKIIEANPDTQYWTFNRGEENFDPSSGAPFFTKEAAEEYAGDMYDEEKMGERGSDQEDYELVLFHFDAEGVAVIDSVEKAKLVYEYTPSDWDEHNTMYRGGSL